MKLNPFVVFQPKEYFFILEAILSFQFLLCGLVIGGPSASAGLVPSGDHRGPLIISRGWGTVWLPTGRA